MKLIVPILNRLRLRRGGFTLFEVSISLAIVAFGVVSVLIMLPTGIKAQQMARYQILASAMAMEMMDQFTSAPNTNHDMEREGVNPWDTYSSYRSYAPDFETRISTHRFGLFPVPLDIARRFDSDNDEIAQILYNGGYVYYSHPLASIGFNEVGTREQMPLPNENQKIICAVVGYAQQNALTFNPWKDWPYYAPYPSPPMHGPFAFGKDSQDGTHNSGPGAIPVGAAYGHYEDANGTRLLLLENTLPADEGDMGLLYRAIIRNKETLPLTTAWVDDVNVPTVVVNGEPLHRNSGYYSYGESGWVLDCHYVIDGDTTGLPRFTGWRQVHADGQKRNNEGQGEPSDRQPEFLPGTMLKNPVYQHPLDSTPVTMKQLSRESALAYFALAYWYAERKKVSTKIKEGVALNYDKRLLTSSELFSGGNENIALAVNAARFLAHAAMCVTAHFQPENEDGIPAEDEAINFPGQFEVFAPTTNPGLGSTIGAPFTIPFALDKTRALTYVENAMHIAMRYAATYPYDFGAPRPLNRSIMMDFPLLQYDPFGGLVNPDNSGFGAAYSYYGGATPDGTTSPFAGGHPAPYQWRLTGAQPITNIGRSFSYPKIDLSGKMNDVRSQSPKSRFTLTHPFVGADRCRQLVFYAVDWQAYEDFETAPSAPVDASRYPKWAPHNKKSTITSLLDDLSGGGMGNRSSFDDRFAFGLRNPEKTILFTEDTAFKETGEEIPIIGLDAMHNFKSPDRGVAGKDIFSGLYGADRNFNGTGLDETTSSGHGLKGRLDRGPVPKSVRMRASVIARFNFYDPRLPLVVR